jgi:hypothetical protein
MSWLRILFGKRSQTKATPRAHVVPRLEGLEERVVPTTTTSSNWSGYAVTAGAGAVNYVTGTWQVPTVTSSGQSATYSSAWVGIDGYGSSTVEQTGTSMEVHNGVAQYYAWYEMYPAAPVTIPVTIHAGDMVRASVSYIGSNEFTLSLTDISTGGSYSTTRTLANAHRSSAEWIVEAPASGSGVLPLAHFSPVTFGNDLATINGTTGVISNGWSGTTMYQINMVNSQTGATDTTSNLTSNGQGFTVTYGSGSGSSGGGGGQGTYEVGEFAGQGVWRHSASGWQQLTSADATQVAVDGQGDVVGEFAGYGVWRYEDSTGWQQLTSADASQIFIVGNGTVIGEFAGYGVWRFADATGWQQLTSADASQLAVSSNGIVVGEFAGYGVWRFENATGWQQLTGANASHIGVDANGDVVGEFQGYGVWRYENGWQQLTSSDATAVSIGGNGIVAGEFQGYGVWRFENGWQQLTSTDASQIAVNGNGDVVGEFQGYGVWHFADATGWNQVTAANALFVAMNA